MDYSSNVPYADITLVELLALKQGLSLAWDCGYRDLICETDCLEVFQLVQSPRSSHTHVLDGLL